MSAASPRGAPRKKRRPPTERKWAGRYKNGWIRSRAGSVKSRSLDDCLGLIQAVNLQLAVLHPGVEVNGDEVAPGRDLLEELEGRVEVVLVRRALRLLSHHGLLLARDLTLEIGLGALKLPDRVIDLALEGLVGGLRGGLLRVGLLHVLLDVRLDEREDVEDALALTLRLLVGVRLPRIRRRRWRFSRLDEGLPAPANLRL